MKVIGFNFTGISAQRRLSLAPNHSISTDIEFLNVEKDTLSSLGNLEAIKVEFKYLTSYTNEGKKKDSKDPEASITLEGMVLLSADKDESKDLLKAWKKKELPGSFKINLFNLILRKCTLKALEIEDEINLPPHFALPKIVPKKSEKE